MCDLLVYVTMYYLVTKNSLGKTREFPCSLLYQTVPQWELLHCPDLASC